MRKYLTGNVYLIATLAVIAFAYWLSIGALADEQDARQPTLGDLMTLTQLRHLKLGMLTRKTTGSLQVTNWISSKARLAGSRSCIPRHRKSLRLT